MNYWKKAVRKEFQLNRMVRRLELNKSSPGVGVACCFAFFFFLNHPSCARIKMIKEYQSGRWCTKQSRGSVVKVLGY